MKKRGILAVLLSFCLLFCPAFTPVASAAVVKDVPQKKIITDVRSRNGLKPVDNGKKIVTKINEYILFKECKSKSNNELLKSGLTESKINYIKNFDFAKAIRDRAKLSKKALKCYGYTDGEIKNLKEMANTLAKNNNNLDAVHPEAITGTLTCGIEGAAPEDGMNDCTGNIIGAYIYWEWDHCPLICMNDIIAVRWIGSNSAGQNLNTEIQNSQYDVQVNYVMENWKTLKTVYSAWNVKDLYHAAYVNFPLNRGDEEVHVWAQNGTAYLIMDRIGTDPIYCEGINFAYGHQTIALGMPSIDFSGASISFSKQVSIAGSVYTKVYSSGYYDGQK